MFSKQQIDLAESKVKSGTDYPQLVQELKELGVLAYDHYVADGSNLYYGDRGHSVVTDHGQGRIVVNESSSADKLKQALKIHQSGETDYPTFCAQAGEAGVEKWACDLAKMTVSYFDKAGQVLATEEIPKT